MILSTPLVDYDTNRVIFGSRYVPLGSQKTLWCLQFTDSTVRVVWSDALNDIDIDPNIVNGTLYVCDRYGTMDAVDSQSGTVKWTMPTGDGPVNGFVIADFLASPIRLYFTTRNSVWSVTDLGTSIRVNWKATPTEVPGLTGPSFPLYLFGQDIMLVGSKNGRLYQFSRLTNPFPAYTSVQIGNGKAAVGGPSYDAFTSSVYVSTAAGAFYSVRPPLP